MSSYLVQLTARQIIGLVDIDAGYVGEDSPRFDGRTLGALFDRKGLITIPTIRSTQETKAEHRARILKARLTKKGEAYLTMARFEYRTATAFLRAAEAA